MDENIFSDKAKLALIVGYFNISIAEFSRIIGLKNSEFYQINTGKQKEFSRATMIAIAQHCPELSPYWLITGEGSMLAGRVEHHNAVATDHSTATVTHSESISKERDSLVTSQQQTIERLSKIIEILTSKQ